MCKNKKDKGIDIATLKSIYDGCAGIVTYKNTDLQFLYCNEYMLQFVGQNKMKNIEGKTDYDMPWEKFADIYTAHERETLLKNTSNTAIFPICDFAGDFKIVTCNRFQISKEGIIEGVLTHTNVVDNLAALEISNLLDLKRFNYNEGTIKSAKFFAEIKLSIREEECLFYFIRGKSVKMIGLLLDISSRTVEKHIESLKQKFSCKYKSDLIDKAFELGYLYHIPNSLLSKIKF